MHIQFHSIRMAGIALGVLAIGGAVLISQRTGAEAATLSATDAVALAIRYAQAPMPSGWLASAPTQANAQLTTLAAATQLRGQLAPDPATKRGRESSRSVWLVFLRGDVVVVSPPAPGNAEQKALSYKQMSVVLDANTGELLATGMHPVDREIAAAGSLPAVAVPRGTPALVPPAPARPTEAPLPLRDRTGSLGTTGAVAPQPSGPAATSTPVGR